MAFERLNEFFSNAQSVRMVTPPPSPEQPTNFAARYHDSRGLHRLNGFLADGNVRAVAPSRQPGHAENLAAKFAESINVPVEYRSREQNLVPRAVAFDKLPPEQAMKQFPELEGAYKMLAAAKVMADKMPSPEANKAFMDKARNRISAELHQGRTVEAPAQSRAR